MSGRASSSTRNGGGVVQRSAGGSRNFSLSTTTVFCKLCSVPVILNLRQGGGDSSRQENLQRMSYIFNLCHEMQLCLHETPEGCSSTNFPLCDSCLEMFQTLWLADVTKETLTTVSFEIRERIRSKAREGMLADLARGKELAAPNQISTCFLCSNLPLVPVSAENFGEMRRLMVESCSVAEKAVCSHPPCSTSLSASVLEAVPSISASKSSASLSSAVEENGRPLVIMGVEGASTRSQSVGGVLPVNRVSVIRPNPNAGGRPNLEEMQKGENNLVVADEEVPDFLCEACGHRTLDTIPSIPFPNNTVQPSPSPTPPPLQMGNKAPLFRRRFLPPNLVRMPKLTPAPGTLAEARKAGKKMKISVQDGNDVSRDFTVTCIDLTSDDE